MNDWKEVKGYHGLYKINSIGEVRNIQGKILKATTAKNGYKVVSLWKNNKGKTKYIHRLIAEHFIPNPNNLKTVNHKDGVKTNNSISNLEWASYSENNRHAFRTGLKTISDDLRENARTKALERNKNKIRSIPVVLIGENQSVIEEWPSAIEAGECLGISNSYIGQICRGQKKSNKYNLKFKEDVKNVNS